MRLSYEHGASSVPLLGETIGANLERTAARFPDNEALVSRHQDLRYTYAEFDAAVDSVARGLLALGIEKGDRVGIWSPNRAEWVLVQYATAKVGAVLVNVNPAYRPAELRYALAQSGCRLLVSARSFKNSDYVSMLDEVRAELPALERAIFLDSPDWDDLQEAGRTVPEGALRERAGALEFDDPINIQYTSGTTGAPKGATLTHHNILNNAYFVGGGCGYTERDRVCIPVPFYHCFGMVMGNLACTARGACMVLPCDAFDARAVLEAVEEERCTSLYGVPTMFIAELGHPEFDGFDLSSLRTGITAGSSCPTEVMRRVISEMHMPGVTVCFGMTETSPVSTQTAADDDLEKRVATVGRVLPHLEVKVVDPGSGRTVPRGTPGEMLVRGYSVMRGYWEAPGRTDEAIDEGGWMHTGDLVEMDEEGYLTVVGRIKDMIIRGGENVYPREVEELLHEHPGILDAYVVGVPDPRYGEEIVAWIKPKDDHGLAEEDVRAFCRERITHFKVPRYVKFVDEFPMTVTGKVQKFLMRRASVEELGLREARASGAEPSSGRGGA